MSRLDDAQKRLHDAISRLEHVLTTRQESPEGDAAAADEALRAELSAAQTRCEELERRMETAAIRLDATIARLRGTLRDEQA